MKDVRPSLVLSALALLTLSGCAKFPKNSSGNGFTRLSFRITLGGAVNPNYIYAVAIRPLTAAQVAAPDNLGPIPVVTSGSRNGIVAGLPTRLVLYSPGQSQENYLVYRFENPSTSASDPDPGTYSAPSEVLTGSGVDPTTSADPNTLGFDITTQDLVDDSTTAGTIAAIQINILAMDQTALNSASISSRHFDALGNTLKASELDSPRTLSIVSSGKYDNTGKDGGQSASITEPDSDVYNAPGGVFPSLDIIDYSVSVSIP